MQDGIFLFAAKMCVLSFFGYGWMRFLRWVPEGRSDGEFLGTVGIVLLFCLALDFITKEKD